MNFFYVTRLQGIDEVGRLLDDHIRIGGDTLAVKSGLREAALAKPRIALIGEQAVAKDPSLRLQRSGFHKARAIGHHYLVDQRRIVDEKSPRSPESKAGDGAVITRDCGEKLYRSIRKVVQVASQEAAGWSAGTPCGTQAAAPGDCCAVLRAPPGADGASSGSVLPGTARCQ